MWWSMLLRLTADAGQKIVALIEAVAPICVEKFSDYPQLGRFTLRDEGRSSNVSLYTVLTSRFIFRQNDSHWQGT